MGLATRKPIPDTWNSCVDMTKQRNALQKSLQMIQSVFITNRTPIFTIFHIVVFSLLLIHYTQRYHTDQYVILLHSYLSPVTVNIMRIVWRLSDLWQFYYPYPQDYTLTRQCESGRPSTSMGMTNETLNRSSPNFKHVIRSGTSTTKKN